ncbi:MAG: hypothetical protein P9M14_04250, partial [Candidatus Alcyoniella australis]|nr:hypothetical protein [Candidatus Alcyoniella australis]
MSETTSKYRTLNLFFTRGVGLESWRSIGMLDRELAIYKKIVEHGWQVRLISYGRPNAAEPPILPAGIEAIALPGNSNPTITSLRAASLLSSLNLTADICKSNQLDGSWAAIMSARKTGARSIARGGYLWS